MRFEHRIYCRCWYLIKLLHQLILKLPVRYYFVLSKNSMNYYLFSGVRIVTEEIPQKNWCRPFLLGEGIPMLADLEIHLILAMRKIDKDIYTMIWLYQANW